MKTILKRIYDLFISQGGTNKQKISLTTKPYSPGQLVEKYI